MFNRGMVWGTLALFTLGAAAPQRARSEAYFAILGGPSTSLKQDLKFREHDAQGNIIKREVVASESFLRFKIGTKLTYFFTRRLGMETEYFYGQMLTGITGHNDSGLDIYRQTRNAFIFSLLYRQPFKNAMSAYAGMGVGWIYSDFEAIGNSWDYGGQLIGGWDYPVGKRYSLFLELKYFWAPDVIDEGRSAGKHYKTSGNSKGNLASHIFGPHYDTQVLALMMGARFRITD